MKNRCILFLILFELLIFKNASSQYARIELWSDTSKLKTSDEINLVKSVEIYEISANEGDVFSEEYFSELLYGKFVSFTFFKMKVDEKLLSYIKNIQSEHLIFNDCVFNDSILNFNNKHILYLELNSCNIKRIGTSIRRIKQLKALSIRSSNIELLPNWIFKLKKLNLLDLTENPISNLDKVLRKNSQLKHLKLQSNDLEYEDVSRIPCMLTGLVSLQIRSNNFNCDEFKRRHDTSKYEFSVCD
ncbi:MAG: hypothetical protein IPJ26_07570 [Bacteroidetes bacterium]|nr:hypothetical protein [Bacteroidota bacterium]